MDTQDHMAFLESQLTNDPTLSFDERVAVQEELIEYYACLAELENTFHNDELSDDERENAYNEYCELMGETYSEAVV